MKDSSRRSFVKTSAATGLTFTFAGLIRAHGQSGGGNTTWNPEGTFFSTNSGETTTYDPNGTNVTTDPGVTTTWDPDATTCVTTLQTTVTTEKPKCEWVILVQVVFFSKALPPDQDHAGDLNQRSGYIYSGVMYCKLKDCSGNTRIITFNVECGGYDVSPVLIGRTATNVGSDTSIPPGSYYVARNQKNNGNIPEGHIVSPNPPLRTDILVHGPKRNPGSSGCVVIVGNGEFARWKVEMAKKPCYIYQNCDTVPYENPVPMNVYYGEGLNGPNYQWNINPPPALPAPPPLFAIPLP